MEDHLGRRNARLTDGDDDMSRYGKLIQIFVFTLLLGGSAAAQISADEAIGYIDQLPASKLDPALPRTTPFLSWMQELFGPAAKIHWELNDCGELTGVAAVDQERDISVCLEATIVLSNTQKVGIAIRIGSEKKGLSDAPTLANIYLESGEEVAYFKKLSELQRALQIVQPKK
jgi:hypothetical protein